MFLSRSQYNRLKRLHHRCLKLIYSENSLSYEELLEKDGSVSPHQRSLQALAIEMFKVAKGLSPEIMKTIFELNDNSRPNLRNTSQFKTRRIKTTHFGTESLSFLGPKIWDQVPQELKNIEVLQTFKKAIKNWVPNECPCRLCKTYLHGVGFIEISN